MVEVKDGVVDIHGDEVIMDEVLHGVNVVIRVVLHGVEVEYNLEVDFIEEVVDDVSSNLEIVDEEPKTLVK